MQANIRIPYYEQNHGFRFTEDGALVKRLSYGSHVAPSSSAIARYLWVTFGPEEFINVAEDLVDVYLDEHMEVAS